MVLGNMVTNLINSSVAPAQRQAIARSPVRCNRPLTTIPRTKDNEQQYMVTLRQPYREKVSQMVSWGHWFALFNMLLAMALGSRYLFVADWPTTLAGRVFSYVSLVGHFSFLVFTSYVLILFPLTFIVGSQRLMRFLSVIFATAGMTLLLIDSEVFTRFHLHLNPVVWELVINPDQNEMARDWQLMFISVPIIFLIEMLFATELAKAAQPDAPPSLRAPRRPVFLYFIYQQPPDLYLGGC